MKVVVLTGAGMSAESGVSTFRDSDGLWEQYNVEDVATPEGWMRNPQMVTSERALSGPSVGGRAGETV